MTDNNKNTNKDKEVNLGVYDTHKFLFTLFHENRISGHEVEFLSRDGDAKTITLKDIEIGSSPVSCKLYCTDGNRHLVPFVRIRKIFKDGELVWDNSDNDLSDSKIIKGYD